MCERAGSIWKAAFHKAVFEVDPQNKTEVEELTDQINNARNSLVRKEGHSPYQHVMGQDVRVPGSLLEFDRVEQVESALQQGETTSERAHRIRMAARQAFLQVDSEDRIRRALGHRTRPSREPFTVGQAVIIWRKGKQEQKCHWHGPGSILGVQPNQVWVALGAKVYRCAPEQVRHQTSESQQLMMRLPEHLQRHRDTVRERGAGNIVELDRQQMPPELEIERDLASEFEPRQQVDMELDDNNVQSEDENMDNDEHHSIPGISRGSRRRR